MVSRASRALYALRDGLNTAPAAGGEAGHVGGLTDLGARFHETGKIILAGYWRDVGAIIHPISAPKMERASIFLHAAS